MKQIYRTSWRNRLRFWLHPGRYFIGIDHGAAGGDMTCKMYGKFIDNVLHITRVEYENYKEKSVFSDRKDPYERMKKDQRKGLADYS